MPGRKRPPPQQQQPAAAAAPADDDADEEAFPRGGARDDLTPLERRSLALQAEADFASEQQQQLQPGVGGEQKQATKKQKRDADDGDDAEGAFFSKQAGSKAGQQQVLQLKAKNLHVGMKLLACVLEVSDQQLTLSLPHGLRAVVPASETSDLMHQALDPTSKRGAKLRAQLPGGAPPPLTQLFSVGQYVRCVIQQLSGGSGDAAAAAANGSAKGSGKRVLASLRLKLLAAGLAGSSGAVASEVASGLMQLGQVLPAVVTSVEDRGYALSFGLKGVSGFLPASDYAAHFGGPAVAPPLLPGALLEVVVSKGPAPGGSSAALLVQTSVAHDAVAGGSLKAWDGLSLNALLPGMLVTARIRQVGRGGLVVSFGGWFSGTIDASHLPVTPGEDWTKRYQVGQKLPARLLYVDQTTKSVGLSCLTHIINLRLPTAVPAMGQVFADARVVRVEPGLGLMLALPLAADEQPQQQQDEDAAKQQQPPTSKKQAKKQAQAQAQAQQQQQQTVIPGFAHISNLTDGSQVSDSELAKRFKAGSVLPARVIGFRLVDGLVALSCKPSVIEQQIYSVKDLYPGQTLEVTALDEPGPSGLLVALTPSLRGLVPPMHLADSGAGAGAGGGSGKKAKQLRAGRKLTARVLTVDLARKHVTLSLKKGLLGSKLPVLSDLRQAAPGMKLHGVVTGIEKYGVFVTFYGGVAGLMPAASLALLPGQEAGDVYSPGQLLRVQVVSADLRRRKLHLAPAGKKSAESEQAAAFTPAPAPPAAAADHWGGHTVGSVIEGDAVVTSVTRASLEEGGGLLELTVTGADGRSEVKAQLPAAHLSDHPGGVEALMSVMKPGLTLPGPLLVLQTRRLFPGQRQTPARLRRWGQEDKQQQKAGRLANGSSAKQQQGPDGGSSGSSESESDAEDDEGKAAADDKAGSDGGDDDSDTFVPLLLLTRKPSLLAAAAAGRLPLAASKVAPGAVLPGYVANITGDGVFVRFLGRVTGRAGLPQMADMFVTDPARHFNLGQSVNAAVLTHDAATGRFSLSLKPSVAGRSEGAYLASLAADLELAFRLHLAAEEAAAAAGEEDEEGAPPSSPHANGSVTPATITPTPDAAAAAEAWPAGLAPGQTVGASHDHTTSYGAIMDLEGQEDLVGLVYPDHGAGTLTDPGQQATACVVDVNKVGGIVELSLLPELVAISSSDAAAAAAASGGKRKQRAQQQQQQLEVGQEVAAVVQVIKDQYVVVAVRPQQQQQQQQHADDDEAAGAAGGGDTAAAAAAPAKKKRKQQQSGGADAAAIKAGADSASQQQQQQQPAFVALGFLARGDMNSQGSAGREVRRFCRGQVLAARVAALPGPDNGSRLLLELAQPPTSTGAAAAAAAGKDGSRQKTTALVSCRVLAVHDWNMEVAVGKAGKPARIHIAELQERLTELPPSGLLSAFKVDQQLTAAYLGHPRSLQRTKDTQLSLRPSALEAAKTAPAGYDGKRPFLTPVLTPDDLHPRLLVVGWVTSIQESSLWVTLAPGMHGRVHVFETSQNPAQLSVPLDQRYSVGQAVRAVVKGVDARHHAVALSLRPDRLAAGLTDPAAAAAAAAKEHQAAAAAADADDDADAAAGDKDGAAAAAAASGSSKAGRRLPPAGSLVVGRVSKVLGAGVVIELTKALQGLAALTDLHDSWAPNALSGLAPGQFVRARVLGAAAAPGSDGCGSSGSGSSAQPPLVDKQGQLLLSLRPSDGGAVGGVQGWGCEEAPAECHEQPEQQSKGRSSRHKAKQPAAAAPAPAAGGFGAPLLDVAALKPGDEVKGYVRGVSAKGLFLTLDRAHHGRVIKSRLSDGFIEDLAAAFPIGALLTARLVAVSSSSDAGAAGAAGAGGKQQQQQQQQQQQAQRWEGVPLRDDGVRLELSLRSAEAEGAGQRGFADFREGQLTQGKVVRIEPYGVFVQLARSALRGLTHVSQVDPALSKDLPKHYTPGQVVSVRVLSVDEVARKITLSMKSELLVGSESEGASEDDSDGEPGQQQRRQAGKRARLAAADFDDEAADALDQQQQQQRKQRRQAGSSSEEEDDDDEGMEEDEDSDGGLLLAGSDSEQQDDDEDLSGPASQSEDVDLDDMDISDEDEEGSDGDDGSGSSDDDEDDEGAAAGLLDGAAGWGELQLADDAGEGADGPDAEQQQLSRADRKRAKAAKEAAIRAAEASRLAGGGQAGGSESGPGYEAALAAAPNDSYTWIKYMAYQLKLGEVEAARRIAERALASIDPAQQAARFNVWVAALNLEDAYGGETAEAGLMGVFNRALAVCEPKPLYIALAGILARSQRWALLSEVWRTATRKFPGSCKVWLGAYEASLAAAARAAAAAAGGGGSDDDDDEEEQQGDGDAAAAAAVAASSGANAPRVVLERALKALPQRKHIKALTRAALAEFRAGTPEAGRSIFEGLVANHPRRTDLWNVYIDQEVKGGDPARIRSLLARATSLALPPKKMRGFFRRWLEWESAHGSAGDVAGVKERARAYMQAQGA